MHGKASEIQHDGQGLFKGIPSPLSVVRYHSLSVKEATLPKHLIITAKSNDGELMGLRHKENLFESVQFHPDSVMTESGPEIFLNFLQSIG